MESTIPEQHWHQNDPGVVPNVLITGAGSPSGMTFYEGNSLPSIFRNTPVHAEPYYNVVRAYLPARKGAGYTLELENLLRSTDKWFRPIDVATAPDGSLFVADWYDPILGGGAAADATQGRIYRVAPKRDAYAVVAPDLQTVSGAIEALKNPNPATHYLAFKRLVNDGSNARSSLDALWNSDNDIFRARALWVLAKVDSGDAFLNRALRDRSVDIRFAAIRAVVRNRQNVVPYLTESVKDENAAVRREAAIALRYTGTLEAANLWTELAKRYDGKDRWYLEALGIASDLHADLFFDTWRRKVEIDLRNKVHQDIIWRCRSRHALPLLAELIKNESDAKSYLRYFRAFDFHTDPSKNQLLISLLDLPRADSKEIAALALQQMDGSKIVMTPTVRRALESALENSAGTVAYVNLVEKFSLKDKRKELLTVAMEQGDQNAGPVAAAMLLKFGETQLIKKALHAKDSSSIRLLQSLKGKGNAELVALLADVVQDSSLSLNSRKTAVQVLGSSWPGEEKLLALVKEGDFDGALKPAAAGVLFNVYRSRIQREAAQYLPKPAAKETNLPTIKQLMASAGNSGRGESVFKTHCISCHKIEDDGVKFGPELSLIGDKLSKEGLYRAVIFPSEGISFGFESTLISLRDGSESMGIVASETADELVLSLPGGSSLQYPRADIRETSKTDQSLMPSLAPSMTEQELVDLVEYLSYLKR